MELIKGRVAIDLTEDEFQNLVQDLIQHVYDSGQAAPIVDVVDFDTFVGTGYCFLRNGSEGLHGIGWREPDDDRAMLILRGEVYNLEIDGMSSIMEHLHLRFDPATRLVHNTLNGKMVGSF